MTDFWLFKDFQKILTSDKSWELSSNKIFYFEIEQCVEESDVPADKLTL